MTGECRYYPNRGKPVLIYLPGVHGDATLFTSFRIKAAQHLQIVEFTYPRARTWSLIQYADFVLEELRRQGLKKGWLLAESYSSQVAWAILERASADFVVEGIILAGGFVRYPIPVLAARAAGLMKIFPHAVWHALFSIYGWYAQFRHRRAPETKAAVEEFIQRRTPEDLAAMSHRMELIAKNDPREIARHATCPIYLLAGVIDPVVLGWPVLLWLQRNCPSFAGHHFVWPADHNVLGTEPEKALSCILEWIHR